MSDRITRWLMSAMLLPLAVVACDTEPIGTDTAQVSLLLTDNPGDVEYAWVDIGDVYLQGGGERGRETLLTAEEAEELGEDGLVELTELADATLELASDVTISAGNYGQLRFVVEGAVLETEDGDVFTFNAEHPDGDVATGSLTCPSCSETGIKVDLSGNAGNLQGDGNLLLLDFDVRESFGREAGASDTWVMNPVIRSVDVAFTGTIWGSVDVARDEDGEPELEIPACPDGTERDVDAFIPRATAQSLTDDEGDPIVTTTEVNEDGEFALGFLEPDDYDLGYADPVNFNGAELHFEAEVDPATVSVSSGGEEEVEYTIVSATCEE